MSKVKVILEKGEDEIDAQIAFEKIVKSNEDIHLTESWDDPAMMDAQDKMLKVHDKIYKEMIAEISEALKAEYE